MTFEEIWQGSRLSNSAAEIYKDDIRDLVTFAIGRAVDVRCCETCGCLVAIWTQGELDAADERAKAKADWYLNEPR